MTVFEGKSDWGGEQEVNRTQGTQVSRKWGMTASHKREFIGRF